MTDPYYAIGRPLVDADGGQAAITTVRLSGEFDLGARHDLHAAVIGAVTTGHRTSVLIDLADVTFIDAVTVGVLIEGYIAAQQRRLGYQVANAHGLVLRVLDVLDPTNLLHLRHPRRACP